MKRFMIRCAAGLVSTMLIVAIVPHTGCRMQHPTVSETWLAMGTFVTLVVPVSDKAALPVYTEAVRGVIAELDTDLTVYTTNSEISVLNRAAGKESVPVSGHTRDVLEESRRYARISGGAFDPALAPIVRLWGFSGASAPTRVPGTNIVRSTLSLCGQERLVLTGRTARLDREGAAVDLGGIAKGFAVDRAYATLVEMGAQHFMINLGGNIRCRGDAEPGRRPWTVGVRNPFLREQIVGSIDLSDGMALATSGNYERFVTIGNARYAHIIDPRTGYPVSGMAGVTIVSPSATEADAMSTALFVLGVEEGQRVLETVPGCHALFVPDRQPPELLATPGFVRVFSAAPGFTIETVR